MTVHFFGGWVGSTVTSVTRLLVPQYLFAQNFWKRFGDVSGIAQLGEVQRNLGLFPAGFLPI